MRKITADAIRAFRNNKTFKRGNTQVVIFENSRQLRLHGHIIAQMNFDGQLWLNDGGWASSTTKERLNGFPSVHIVQRNFIWYLNGEAWNGRTIQVDW